MSDRGARFTPPGAGAFHTTRWSLVVTAAGEGQEARAGLEELCTAYWYPLYSYVRRRGHGAAQAEDLTQGFFARLIERRDLAVADPERGRFRSYLLGALKHYLANEWDKERAQKRGGGATVLSIDWRAADRRFGDEPAGAEDPERSFERQWALATLERALARLREEYEGRGKGALFARLEPELSPAGRGTERALLAEELGMSEGAVKVAIHRLRERFGQALRAEIADTLHRPEEVEAELADLLAALGE